MEYMLVNLSSLLIVIACLADLTQLVSSWSQEWSPKYVSSLPGNSRPGVRRGDCAPQGRQHAGEPHGHKVQVSTLDQGSSVSTGCQPADLSPCSLGGPRFPPLPLVLWDAVELQEPPHRRPVWRAFVTASLLS
ncbi:hypothetical protein PoB_004007800 [Plakobranchus ocellatus]|uniref:Uncharacterized protein n=1 Tax=Plakobranchus ocellatus TaxID=259542 RepID=A0AAV4B478_9GAST|nr:hypothetical protein PoB_004007800 [Plakobranchus ocellatus]